jgi:hypothetical protein
LTYPRVPFRREENASHGVCGFNDVAGIVRKLEGNTFDGRGHDGTGRRHYRCENRTSHDRTNDNDYSRHHNDRRAIHHHGAPGRVGSRSGRQIRGGGRDDQAG